MQAGKNKSSQKTREPYGKVTEVGQVPIALQEIRELARFGQRMPEDQVRKRFGEIESIAESIIAVTCANPGCLSQMAEGTEVENVN